MPPKTAEPGARSRTQVGRNTKLSAPKTEYGQSQQGTTINAITLSDSKTPLIAGPVLVYGEHSASVQRQIPRMRSPTPDSVEDDKGDVAVSEILKHSTQVVSLKYDHLSPGKAMENARKLGLLSGTKQAIAQGITTKTEIVLGTGAKTNPDMRLNYKEQEYVLSQLLQKNYENRQGFSVFKSKTGRSAFIKSKNNNPPCGFYEQKFENGRNTTSRQPRVYTESSLANTWAAESAMPQHKAVNNEHVVDLKYIHKSYERRPTTQHFSCFSDTRTVDFTKN